MKETALDKFLRYIKIDTQSNDKTGTTPSTKKQFDLANLLVKELKAIGLADAEVDEHCYVMATLESNSEKSDLPTIGLLAHVDTSPEVSGANVKANIIENYQGGDIPLPGDENVIIKVSENPKLKECIGHKIVTSDGTTLLGADNKAGVAAIMSAVEYLVNHPEIKHGRIRIAFTPDEEIGQGTKFFDIKKFGTDYAYTIDGELPGELNKETFSADSCTVTAKGRDIHPGSAKNIMVNSIRIISEFISRLPKDIAPETTEGYEPFIHPYVLEGSIAQSSIKMLFRDFDTKGLPKLKEIVEKTIAETKQVFPNAEIEMVVSETYRNMRDKLDENPIVLEKLWEASKRAGAEPFWSPIRGGTDGSRLTEMGLPTPNVYTGGQNFHSKTEWLSVNALNKTVDTIVELAKVWAE